MPQTTKYFTGTGVTTTRADQAMVFTSSRIPQNNMSVTSSFKVSQYMFCHPEQVVLRKGRSRLLKWKHLMFTSELRLSIKSSKLEHRIESLHLSEGALILEEICPFHKFATRSMTVIAMESWISFKWITRKGITQFQCELQSPNIVRHVASRMSSGGIRVILKGVNERIESNIMHYDSRPENCSQNTPVAFEGDEFSQEPPLPRSQGYRRHELQISQEPTQVEPEMTKSYYPNPNSFRLRNSEYGAQSFCSYSSTPTKSIRNSDYISLFGQASRVSAKMREQTSELCNIDIEKLILSRKSLHLSVDTYSFVSSSRRPLKWKHMGLISDVCLSLVPWDHNGHPVVLLSRGTEVEESFVPYQGHLRAFFTNDILAFRQLNGEPKADRYIQMHMKQANIAVTCEWLSYFNIHAEDPHESAPFTEETTMHSVSSRRNLGSEISFGSRQSRFWARRLPR